MAKSVQKKSTVEVEIVGSVKHDGKYPLMGQTLVLNKDEAERLLKSGHVRIKQDKMEEPGQGGDESSAVESQR